GILYARGNAKKTLAYEATLHTLVRRGFTIPRTRERESGLMSRYISPLPRRARLCAFTVIEVLVVIGIITVLMAILLPTAERVRHQAYIDKCASNLRQIGMAMQTYAQENHGNYPRTPYNGNPATYVLNQGTGVNAPDAFQGGGVKVNDLTAPLFLLL